MIPFFQSYAQQVLPAETLNALRLHAEEAYPQECVGAVLQDDSYIRLVNIAADPEKEFAVRDAELLPHAGRLKMIHHSHPMITAEANGRDGWHGEGPSVADQEAQLAWDLPFAITHVIDGHGQEPLFWGAGLPRASLYGRPFVHGVYDCMSFIRDWFAEERGIEMDNPVRGFGWWDKPGQDLYAANFKAWGFEEIDIGELRPGDVVLAMIGARVLNHGAVWLGQGLIGHHLRAQLSRREPIGHWQRFVCKAVRHVGPAKPEAEPAPPKPAPASPRKPRKKKADAKA